MTVADSYHVDRSLKGKLRRRLARLMARRDARLVLERPMVSFTFDDPPASAAGLGAQILERHGVRGTYFIAAGLASTIGAMGPYAGRPEVMALAAAGHELACHTFSHLDCGLADAATIEADVNRNQAELQAWGAPPSQSFAYPYGEISLQAKRALGGRYALLRAIHHGLIETGSDLNQAPSVGIEGPHGEAQALRWLDRAASRKAWLILYSHDISDRPTAWGCTPEVLDGLVSKAVARGFDVVTVAEGAQRLR